MSALISDLASYWVARDASAALGPHTPVLWSSGPHTRTTRWGGHVKRSDEATARVFVMCDDEHAVLNKYTKRQFFAV